MPDAKSWRKRRWDLFLKTYNSSPEFRASIKRLGDLNKHPDALSAVATLLIKYRIPITTMNAVIAYLSDPNIPEKKCYELIHSPITFWSKHSKEFTPGSGSFTLQDHMNAVLHPVRKRFNISDEDAPEFSEKVINAIAMSTTIIQVQPYTGKSELRDVVMEFGDEIQKLTAHQQLTNDYYSAPDLNKRVFTPPTQSRINRDNLILNLKNKGFKYKEIQKELESRNLEVPDEDLMKQIVYRLRKKLKDND